MTSLAISLYRSARSLGGVKQPFSAFRAAYFDKLQSAHFLLLNHITYVEICNCRLFSPYAARSCCREPRQEEELKAAVGFAPSGSGSSDRSFCHVTPPRFGRSGVAPPFQRLRPPIKRREKGQAPAHMSAPVRCCSPRLLLCIARVHYKNTRVHLIHLRFMVCMIRCAFSSDSTR